MIWKTLSPYRWPILFGLFAIGSLVWGHYVAAALYGATMVCLLALPWISQRRT